LKRLMRRHSFCCTILTTTIVGTLHFAYRNHVVNLRSLNEVRSLYGLDDPDVPAARADEIVNQVFGIFGKGTHETISRQELVSLLEAGRDLPDCEFDGHHGDEEWEVRISLIPPRTEFVAECSMRYIMLNNFIWTMIATSQNGIIQRI
jgi:hypothetical protein